MPEWGDPAQITPETAARWPLEEQLRFRQQHPEEWQRILGQVKGEAQMGEYHDAQAEETKQEIRDLEIELQAKKAELGMMYQEGHISAETATSAPIGGPEQAEQVPVPNYDSLSLPKLGGIDEETAKLVQAAHGNLAEQSRILRERGYQSPEQVAPVASTQAADGVDRAEVLTRARNAGSAQEAAAILREAGITAVGFADAE